MRGSVFRPGRRRTVSVLLAVVAGTALAVMVLFGSAATALGKTIKVQVHPLAPVVHSAPVVKTPPPIAHAAGHKIA